MGAILDRLKSLIPWGRAARRKRLHTAADYLLAEWRKTVGVQGTRKNRSLPGEPPRKQTGELQASLFARVEDDLLVIGSTAKHAGLLESGTRRMAARPHRAPTLERCRPTLLRILKG